MNTISIGNNRSFQCTHHIDFNAKKIYVFKRIPTNLPQGRRMSNIWIPCQISVKKNLHAPWGFHFVPHRCLFILNFLTYKTSSAEPWRKLIRSIQFKPFHFIDNIVCITYFVVMEKEKVVAWNDNIKCTLKCMDYTILIASAQSLTISRRITKVHFNKPRFIFPLSLTWPKCYIHSALVYSMFRQMVSAHFSSLSK